MTKLEEIEKAASALSPEEMAGFRRWFDLFDAKLWDAQIVQDAKDGKLDKLAQQALKEHETGRSRKL